VSPSLSAKRLVPAACDVPVSVAVEDATIVHLQQRVQKEKSP
jgi:hypothetical protein